MFVPDSSHSPRSSEGIRTTGPEFARRCHPWLASTACHLAAMIALGISAAVGVDVSKPMELTIRLDEGDIASDVASFSDDGIEFHSQWSDPAPAAGPLRMFESFTAPATNVEAPISYIDAAILDSGREGAALADFGSHGEEVAKGTSQFFGVNGYGNSIVYVVDCSGSMSDHGKLERAKYELLHSIEQLSSDQKYFIIFYSDDAFPMDGNAPVRATEDALRRTRGWIAAIRANGGTNPQPALLAALSLHPDTIYFLSDGLFDAGTIAQVRRLNRRRQGGVPIHSIAFVNRDNLALMRAISRDSGGEFRFVR